MRRLSLATQELRHADLETELYLEFQPIHDLLTRRPIGLEALGRWHNARLGMVGPEEFIRIAERTDIILRITDVLLRQALAEVAQWPSQLYLSFNLSEVNISTSARAPLDRFRRSERRGAVSRDTRNYRDRIDARFRAGA